MSIIFSSSKTGNEINKHTMYGLLKKKLTNEMFSLLHCKEEYLH